MLSDKKIKELVEYWVTNSREKLRTMKSLYENKRYSDCLFFGHMVLEMILKALTVQKTGNPAPKTHNLKYLSELAEL